MSTTEKLIDSQAFHDGFGSWLYLEHVFFAYDGIPIFSTCLNDSKERFFCHCVEFRNLERWVIHPIESGALADILENKIRIYQGLEQNKQPVVIFIDDWGAGKTKLQRCAESDLGPENLPDKDSYLRVKPHRWDEFANSLRNYQTRKELCEMLEEALNSRNYEIQVTLGKLERTMNSDVWRNLDSVGFAPRRKNTSGKHAKRHPMSVAVCQKNSIKQWHEDEADAKQSRVAICACV